MDLISKRDALDKVHKTIENLILRLPRVRGVDGEDYCADPASLAAYNMAYEHIRREIQGIQAWHNVVDKQKVRQVLLEEFGEEEAEAIDALMERMKE